MDDCIARVLDASRRGHENLMPASFLARLDVEHLRGCGRNAWALRTAIVSGSREGDEVVGYAWVCPADLPDEDASELHLIYVAPHR